VPRTAAAIRCRAKRLGLSLWGDGWSLVGLERLFRIDHRAIVRWWVAPGLLPARRWPCRGAHPGWWFAPAPVEACLRDCPWAYDWRRMSRRHPLTQLAELVNRVDPWLGYEELRGYLGVSRRTLDRWLRHGLVPHRRRPGAGGVGRIVVRRADFPAI